MTAVDESRADAAPAAVGRRMRVLRSLLALVVGADLLVLAFSAVLSWNLDLLIIGKTVRAVLRSDGAY